MSLPREFINPSNSYGSESGFTDYESIALRNSVPDVREELTGTIKIDKSAILSSLPTLTAEDLTKEFALSFISGGLPLVVGGSLNEFIFNEQATLAPDKILENYNIGTSMNNNGLLVDVAEDEFSFYVKAQNSGKTRCVLLGKASYFHMKVATKDMTVGDYTRGRNGDPTLMPSEEELKAPITVTGDYGRFAGTPVRDQALRLGGNVQFTFSNVPKARGWVVIPTTEASARCIVSAIDATIGSNGAPIEAFGSVLVKFGK